jgi:hypothetical protein
MKKSQNKKFYERFSESGHGLFTKNQTENRFALCRAAICPTSALRVRFKGVYRSQSEVEKFSVQKFIAPEIFTQKYMEIEELGWGGKYVAYDKGCASYGAFYPFVRTSGARGYLPIDSGCIWIGTDTEYPLIFVQNGVATWISPYSPSGYVRTKPFIQWPKIREHLDSLSDGRIYPDLQIDNFS